METKKSKYVNLDYLKIRTKSNPRLMMEMISLYLQQTPPLLFAMNQSMAGKNWTLLGAAVHKIIPSFSIMGFSPQYENMAKKIQESSNEGQFTEEIRAMVIQLDSICVQAIEELEIELDLLKNT